MGGSPAAELSRAFMDEEHDPAPEPDDDGGPARRSGARRRAAREEAGGRPRSATEDASDGAAGRRSATARPRRWWEQPWVWGIVLVVVLGGALGVSLLVNSNPDDITPTGDTAAFCTAVRSYEDVRDANDAKGSGAATAADDAALQAALGRVQQASPEEIRPTSDALAGALDQVIQVQQDNRTAGTSLAVAAAADAKLSAIDADVQRASIRFTNYTQKACGIDLGATPPAPTLPTGTAAPGSTPVTTAPNVSVSLVTPP
jgi:hypothetical protein